MFSYRDVHFDGKSRGKFHFDEIPQFLKMLKLRGNHLKLKKKMIEKKQMTV